MLVLCRSVSGKSLPENARIMGETDETDFSPLQIGQQYKVYGVMFYTSRIDFLVCPASGGPMWVPSNLFDVVDDEIPQGWGCVLTERSEGYADLSEAFGIHSICGYLELIRSYSHYVGILERDPEELKIFYSQ
ncbi:TPA: hypothetical protein ACY4PR_003053 [Enterobacter cloacae]|uniref:Uncharacterized protein n=1 Tax=Enterobacter chinensis TaxID=3030997 RepID=A0ABU5D4Y2_9ENTR|nr:hypothetical protein [Enterobacter sp. 170198]MDY0418044.1 hypothetical protein [Enterobacter sp. 170198]